MKQWEEFFQLAGACDAQLAEFLAPYGAPPSPVAATDDLEVNPVTRSACLGPKSAHRIDAEFYRKGYEDFERRCTAIGSSFLLGKHFTLRPGSGFKKDDDSNVLVVKQAVLTNYGINWSAIAEEAGRNSDRVSQVASGDILLACTAHEIFYVGRKVDFVDQVPKEYRDNACVGDLMIIRPRDEKPDWLPGEYVAAFLRSDAGRHQVQRCIRGLRGGHVYKDDLAAYVRVPVPPKAWLETFKQTWNQAELARNAGKVKVASAVQDIEDWVSGKAGPIPSLR